MYKFIFILLLINIFLMCSCEEKYDTTFTTNQVLINYTHYNIIYAISTDVGDDSIYSKGNDSVYLTFKKHSTVILPLIGPYSINIEKVKIFSKTLYLLDDTTSYTSKFVTGAVKLNEQDSIFSENMMFLESGSIYNIIEIEKLNFTEKLKQIMQKDYTMLYKFKEYYKK